ncbi:MAG: 3'-5' exonuclease [Nanoarchaeota archaeon]|nr:3'-5' exonuclease [Nanoarchaeota archaeon]
MIVVDIETSGVDFIKNGIWQIGTIDLDTLEEYLDECKIDDEEIVSEESLKVTGKTEEELRDSNKKTQKEMLEKFMEWVEKRKIKNFICQCPQFDVSFIRVKCSKYGIKETFHHRAFDTHSIVQTKFSEINNSLSIKDNKSNFNLNEVIGFCGLNPERVEFTEGKLTKEGKPHNALEDAKLTAECFSRLIYGKNLFPEYDEFKIPENLKK